MIENDMNMEMEDDIVAFDGEQPDSDFPENSDELCDKWVQGDLNGLRVGDGVEFKYVLNLDGYGSYDRQLLRQLVGHKGVINEFVESTWMGIINNENRHCYDAKVTFDDNEIDLIASSFNLAPMHFVKID